MVWTCPHNATGAGRGNKRAVVLPKQRLTSTARLGFISSSGLFIVGMIYIAVVAYGISEVGLTEPVMDPVLAVMELLTILSALLFVVVMSTVYDAASSERKVFGTIALAFAVLMTGLTCAVHFVALTAGRQTGFTVLEWPSVLYAAELLAWDVFLGLALLFAAFVFHGHGLLAAIRWTLLISGALALTGVIGPVLGIMPLQRIGIMGYGIGLPVAGFLLAMFFRRYERT